MVVTIQNYLELKKIMQDKFHINIHFHESCYSQHFSADVSLPEEAKRFICDFFTKWNQRVNFYDSDQKFVLEDV